MIKTWKLISTQQFVEALRDREIGKETLKNGIRTIYCRDGGKFQIKCDLLNQKIAGPYFWECKTLSHKQFVMQEYPNAMSIRGSDSRFKILDDKSSVLGSGKTDYEAWQNAALRIKEEIE